MILNIQRTVWKYSRKDKTIFSVTTFFHFAQAVDHLKSQRPMELQESKHGAAIC